jgi:hypothetical protein
MIVETELKALHIQDPIPIQLGNLASSVKRLGFLIHTHKPEKTVQHLLQECQSFAGWTFPDADPETQLVLANLQVKLANWRKDFEGGLHDEPWRAEVNSACEKWSQKLHGKVVELDIYPREAHGFGERNHRLYSIKRNLEWFDKYVKNAATRTLMPN